MPVDAELREIFGRVADALDLDASDRHALLAAVRPRQPTRGRGPGTIATAFPESSEGAQADRLPTEFSSFVGRESEIGEVRRLLTSSRLLTLTGAGGVGKTRLALRIAAEIQREPASRVAFVGLAGLTAPELLPPAVASALGVGERTDRSPLDLVVEALRPHPVLLLLDNCEHMTATAANVADVLLRACPELRILVTSREPLRVRGETVWRVPSLSLPPQHPQVSPERVGESEAVRLFIERAQACRAEFVFSDRNAATLAWLCRQLDGIPLALELAAARVAVLSVEQIAERLSDALGLLTVGARDAPARQRTLRGTLDWSYHLLTDTEKRLLERLSVFVGGWTLEAAEAICTDEAITRSKVLDGLAGLVTKSLVLSEQLEQGAYRYRLLETIRQYAAEKRAEQGDDACLEQRRAEFFLGLAESLQPQLLGHRARAALDQLEQDQDNMRAALDWLVKRCDTAQAQRLAGALGRYWQLRCHFREGLAWVRRVLALPTSEPWTADRASCLYALGNLLHGWGDIPEAEAANREALAIWRELGNTAEEGWTLFALGHEARLRGDYPVARDLLEQSVAVSRAAGQVQAETNAQLRLADVAFDVGDDSEAQRRADAALQRSAAAGWTPGVALAHRILGEVCLTRGHHESATRHFEASLASASDLGNGQLSAQALVCLGQAAIEQGAPDNARHHLARALDLARIVENQAVMARGLEVFAALAIAAGEVGAGVELVGAAAKVRAAGGARISPREQRWLDNYLTRARAVLGTVGVERALQAGAMLSPSSAVGYALELRFDGPRQCQAERAAPDKLTAREEQTALLVARGMSNRQIAEQLVIGERTVQTHVGNILGKLGLSTRAQIAVWVTEHRRQPKTP